jgi:RNA polymerase sigma factor (sigma-70 family)
MKSRSLGRALGLLRQIASSSDGSRLDAELIERFVASYDGGAFACLVERHGPLVLGVCRRVLRNHHDAEDAFQATFLTLARKARHIRQRDALAGWLYKVAYHLSMKLRASAEKQRQSERQPPPVRQGPADDRVAWDDLRDVLDEELARMPDNFRVPLLLCCLAGRTRRRGRRATRLDPGHTQDAVGTRPAAPANPAGPSRPDGLGRGSGDGAGPASGRTPGAGCAGNDHDQGFVDVTPDTVG